MKPIKAVYFLLSTDSSITANIYPQRIPEGAALPAIVLNQISRVAYDTKKEYSKSDESRVQVTIVAETATEAYELSDLVRDSMNATLPNTFNTVLVQNIAFQNEITLTDDNANEQGVFMVAQDYLIMYSNTSITNDLLLLEDGSYLLLEDSNKILL
jgi:hypothetical protein